MRERALAADVGVYSLSRLGMSARPKGLLFGFGNIPLTLIRDGLAPPRQSSLITTLCEQYAARVKRLRCSPSWTIRRAAGWRGGPAAALLVAFLEWGASGSTEIVHCALQEPIA
jgi:hypothetical protein